MIQRREALTGDFPGGPGGVAKTLPNAGGTSSIPGQGIRFHMPQPRVYMLQLKMLRAAVKIPSAKTKAWRNQINTFFFFFKKRTNCRSKLLEMDTDGIRSSRRL